MSSKFILKVGLIAASLLATSIASANIGFGQGLTNFTLDSDYQGTFTYGGTTYGSGAGNTSVVNLSSLPYDSNGFYRTADNSIYRIYKQTHSAVVGNITRGDADRSFVRDVAGTLTSDSIKNTAANYTYEGVVFNHIAGTEGDLDYTVSVANDGTVTGSGSISGVTGSRPTVGAFTLDGTLDTVTFTASNGKLNAATGTATLTLADAGGSGILSGVSYDIGVYGPNAEEVAGGIYGGDLTDNATGISGYGIAGTKVSP